MQLAEIPPTFTSVEQLATSSLWPTAEELRAGLRQEIEAGNSGEGVVESPVYIGSLRGDAGACDGLLRGRHADNALLTTVDVRLTLGCHCWGIAAQERPDVSLRSFL